MVRSLAIGLLMAIAAAETFSLHAMAKAIATSVGSEHILPTDASCPAAFSVPNGDLNGDGTQDWHLDINPFNVDKNRRFVANDLLDIEFDNGQLQYWCVANPDGVAYIAIVFRNDQGEQHFIAKCPFGGGKNGGTVYYLIVARDTEWDTLDTYLLEVVWGSDDEQQPRDVDDDDDGKVDAWRYYYTYAQFTGINEFGAVTFVRENELSQLHLENGFRQDDGQLRSTPPTSFNYCGLLPASPKVDDPSPCLLHWVVELVAQFVTGDGEPGQPQSAAYPCHNQEAAGPGRGGPGLLSEARDGTAEWPFGLHVCYYARLIW